MTTHGRTRQRLRHFRPQSSGNLKNAPFVSRCPSSALTTVAFELGASGSGSTGTLARHEDAAYGGSFPKERARCLDQNDPVRHFERSVCQWFSQV